MLAAKHTPDVLAITAGLVLAGLLLLGWRVEGGAQPSPAEIEIVTASSADVAVTPAGETAAVSRLLPSSPEKAAVRKVGVRNATRDATQVDVSAATRNGELSRALRLRIVAGDRQVFTGSLDDLQKGTASFALPSGEETTLAIHAWIREDAPEDTWAGRSETVQVELEARD